MKKFIYILAVLILFSNSISVNATESKNLYSHEIQTMNCPKPIDNLAGNYNNKIKVIFSDIDGTLLKFDPKNGKPPIPNQLKDSVKKLDEANIPFVLITGRSYSETKDIADSIGYKGKYIVSLQGAEINTTEGKLIYKDKIKDKDVSAILDDIDYYKAKYKLNSTVYMYANEKFLSTSTIKPVYNWEALTTVNSLKDLGPNYSCSKIVVCEYDPEKNKLIQTALKKKYPNYNVVFAGGCYCDITSATATKGNAVKKLAKIMKVNLKNAAVFGDAENDLSMLHLVKDSGGAAIAVGNAMDILKQNANYITLPVWDCGFSKGVDEILKNNNLLKK